ncbi:MAG: RHS repeat-associated core domain-containing protein, partial [Rhodopirellula sp. JB053]
SSTAVENGELGVWDTSLLLNDEYVIRLEVATSEGIANVVERYVGLAGELKLGNFQLSFTDMVIPVAGIPIEITRIYDTLQADREGDFGYGWRLEYRNTDLRVGLPKSGLEDIGIYSALRPGVKVYLNVPGQGRQGFTFNPDIRVLPGWGGNNLILARPKFTPDPGVTSTLSTGTSAYLHVNELGELHAPGGIPYNPASPDFGGAYVLTTREGITYRVDGASGDLNSATDRNGNRIEFSDRGVESGSGLEIRIQRDSAGRIISLTDPLDESLSYEYVGGLLVGMVDRVGNQTEFVYSATEQRFLTEVKDPLGRGGIRSNYDSDGRLQSTTDRDAQAEVIFTQQLEDGRTIVQRSDGSVETLSYDSQGRVIQIEDQHGGIIRYRYGQFGLVEIKDPLGRITRYAYDNAGNVSSVNLPDGSVSYRQYDQNGQLIQATDALGNSISNQYDNAGNLIREVRGNRTVTYEYDDTGSLIRSVDSVLGATEFVRNADGFILETQSANGRVVRHERDAVGRSISDQLELDEPINGQNVLTQQYDYDANGFTIETIDAAGHTLTTNRNRSGSPTDLVDQLGRSNTYKYLNGQVSTAELSDGTTVDFEYDAEGRVVAATDRDGRIQQFAYDLSGNLIERILPDDTPEDDSDNPRFKFEYDRLNRQTARIDALGNRTQFEYDLAGNVARITYPDSSQLNLFYDSVGQLTQSVDPAGNINKFSYNAQGNILSRVSSDGSIYRFEYDDAGRLIGQSDPQGQGSTYRYDSEGLVTQVTDALGAVHKYEYDTRGNLVAEIDALGRRRTYEYGAVSERLTNSRADGSLVTHAYQPDSRPTTVTGADGVIRSYQYDDGLNVGLIKYGAIEHRFEYSDVGNLLEIQDETGRIVQAFDAENRLIERTDGSGQTVTYGYDSAGNRTSITSAAGTVQYAYNEVGLVSEITDVDGSVYRYQYDTAGRPIELSFNDGSRETRVYDTLGRVVRIRLIDSGDDIVAEYSYAYLANGQIAGITELDGTVSAYRYDGAGQLIEMLRSNADTVLSEIHYEYDLVGNIVRKSVDGVVTTRSYSADNELVTESVDGEIRRFEYDPAGNLVAVVIDSVPVEEYEWDSAGRMVLSRIAGDGRTVETTYRYDWSGLLVAQTTDGVTTEYQYDRSRDLPTIISARSEGRVDSYLHNDRLIARRNNGQNERYLVDASGTIRGIVNANTEIVEQFSYAPFGDINGDISDDSLAKFGFAGELIDPLTKNIYLRQRHYDPSRGRFMSVDSFEGHTSIPLSRHDYQFAYNDPVAGSDPSGQLSAYTIVRLQVAASIVATIAAAGVVQAIVGLGGAGEIEWVGVQVGYGIDASAGPGVGGEHLSTLATTTKTFTGGASDESGFRIATGQTIAIGGSFGASVIAGFNAGGISLSSGSNPITRKLGGAALAFGFILGEVGGSVIVGGAWAPLLTMGFASGNASGVVAGIAAGAAAGAKSGVTAAGSFIGEASDKANIESLVDQLGTDKITDLFDQLYAKYV